MDEVERRHYTAELGTLAAELEKLTALPQWKILKETLEARRVIEEQRISREMFSGGISAKAVDQRKVDYRRGFLDGIDAVLGAPAEADTAFKKATERMNSGG